MTAWWHGTNIYQVYPRSFADSNGDGVGDLAGIEGKLDYIADLGVKTLWVSPFFASPQRDFGYDVADYLGVAPEYGDLDDALRLIEAAHVRGLKVMFDLVLNHTSDQHPWFLQSRATRTNPKSDWYIWADGRGRRGRRRPNNWRSAMEITSAWQWCPERKQWFMATFLPFQPDLNWRNPEVKAAMLDTVRFWLDHGVDGFRLDIFGQIMKDPQLGNNPISFSTATGFPRLWRRDNTENTTDNIELAKDLRAVCAEYGDPDRILLGEVFGPPEVLRSYLGVDVAATKGLSDVPANDDQRGLNLVFLFDFLAYKYDAAWFADIIARFEESFPAPMQPTYVLENHDRTRTRTRVGGDLAKARVLAILLLTLRGVPTLYMGQELGMPNTPMSMRDALDPVASSIFKWLPDLVASRLPETLNRDEMRTPMQWDDSANAGFSPEDVQTWLPVGPTYRSTNVAIEQADPDSIWHLYRTLLHLRADHETLRTGDLTLLRNLPHNVLGYRRDLNGEQLLMLANLGPAPAIVRCSPGAILARTGEVEGPANDKITLGVDAAVLLQTVATDDPSNRAS
ncbi:MAG: alpha-amylase family glycosyl hydrolase [Candidatus Nanopelagicales bacterium]